MTPSFRTQRFAVATLIVLTLAVPSFAQGLLTPNGNPTGPGYVQAATAPWYYSVDPATTSLPWTSKGNLNSVLNTQGYNAANGWTINRFDLPGNYQLDIYKAWAESVFEPAIYGFPAFPRNNPGYGGALFALGWVPNPGAMLPGDGAAHWLQVVNADDRGNNSTNPIFDGHSYWYLDNGGNATSPFYDSTYSANAQILYYYPTRSNKLTSWHGYTFLATWDTRNGKKELDIANQGVFWGFTDPPDSPNPVPAPDGFVLAGIGVAVAMLASRRRQSNTRSKE